MPEPPYLAALLALGRRVRAAAILGLLGLVVVLTPPRAEHYGDNLQIALPLIALGCEIANGSGLEYAGRFIVLQTGISGTKLALGSHPVNQRPNGRGQGFPSGHTSAAVFGAASLVDSCLTRNPVARMAVISAAGFVGASRIEAGKHSIWQVLAGVVWGLGCNCALRRESRARRGVARGLRAAAGAAGRGLRIAAGAGARGLRAVAGAVARLAQAGIAAVIGRSRTGKWMIAEKAPTPTPIHQTAV